MASWLQRFLRRVRIQALELAYEVDLDTDGQFRIRITKIKDGNTYPADYRALLWHDYCERDDDTNTVYVVGDQDRQILLSIKSLNPEIAADGSIHVCALPTRLGYWRKKGAIQESPASADLVIHEQPLAPVAEIDYHPTSGLAVKTGFRLGTDPVISSQDLPQPTSDGYVRIGQGFARLPTKLGPQTSRLLGLAEWNVAPTEIPEFFVRDMVLLRSDFQAVLTDEAQRLRVVRDVTEPVVRVSTDGRGWLDFDVGYQVDNAFISHRETQAQGRGDSYIRPDDYTWVHLRPEVVKKTQRLLDDLGAIQSEEGYRLPIEQFASLEEFIESIGGRAEIAAAYQHFREQLTGFTPDPTFALPEPMEECLKRARIALRPYQRAGIHWLNWLRQSYLHGILADDMGLGKTIQAICAMRLAYEQTDSTQHSLVLCPSSVMVHWKREIDRCFPEIRTIIYHGPVWRRGYLNAKRASVFISTYATAANDWEHLARVPFFYLILDEATQIKNPDAGRTKAAKSLNAVHRLALSGTPVENRPAELWSIFDFLMRGFLGRYGTFVNSFEIPIMQGDKPTADQLGTRIRPFLLRRLKAEVEKDLPPKIEIDEWCELTEEQRQIYGSQQAAAKQVIAQLRQGEYVNYATSILPLLVILKQVCDHPAIFNGQHEPLFGRSHKFDAIIDKTVQITSAGEQVVVFSHFLKMLDLLEEAISQHGIEYMRIDGSTPSQKRQSLIDDFNARGTKVALCSLHATGYGITLTAANHVIHADRWWNPAVEDQATDRVHRIGQDRTVYVHRVLVQGTLEERIDQLLRDKRGVADQIMSGARRAAQTWTREELLDLLRPLDLVARQPAAATPPR